MYWNAVEEAPFKYVNRKLILREIARTWSHYKFTLLESHLAHQIQ